MKVILSGATGFIGSEALRQCLKSQSTTSVVVLSRRSLPESVTSNPKLKVIIMNDFAAYPDTVLEELAGAEACIWALGRPQSTRQVEFEYPMAAVNAFTTFLAPQLRSGKRFRFIYLSGLLAERDQTKTLWFGRDLRRFKGETENGLLELGSKRSDVLETFICRPGLVLSKENYMPSMLVSLCRCIKVDELAAVMMKTALSGSKEQIMENADLRTLGQAMLLEEAGRQHIEN